jgi:hypothetical protein
MIRRISMALLVALAAGCATNLQKADRLLAQGRFAEARGLYQTELDQQRKAAELPRWTGREYQFRFNPAAASKAILGLGNTEREEGRSESALYHYSYFIQYCLRHGLEADAEVAEIERWIREAGLGMPTTKVEAEKPKPKFPPAAARVKTPSPPEQSEPEAVAPAKVAPVAVRKAPPPVAQKKPVKAVVAPDEKPAKPEEEAENAYAPIYW